MNTEKLIKEYAKISESAEFWEIKSKTESFTQQNKSLKACSKSQTQGISARILANGCFGFASSNDCSKKEQVFKTAYNLAKNASRLKKEKTTIKELKHYQAKIKPKAKKDPFKISDQEKIRYLKDFNALFALKEIKNSETTLSFSKSEKTYMNSDSANICQESIYAQLHNEIVSQTESVRSIRRAKKGYELLKFNCANFAKESEEKMKRLMSSKLAKPGKYNLVIDPDISGTFFHEAVGHALEADFIREKSTCISMNEKASIPELTLYDNPLLKDYWGSYEYDDEGIKAKKSTLIKNGEVINFINDKSSYFDVPGLKKTANARMQSIHDAPIPRMSNTQVKPGNYSKQELIEKAKNGLLVKGFSGGAVDTMTGIFSFKADEAFLIKNGKIIKSFKGASLSGDLKQILKNITGISKEFGNPYKGGMCGKKGQSVPVSEKVPYISVRDMNVGN
ncbi:MAG: TldD/PmbA family protein [Candidatus Nanoarchaeia archaeon]|nr:TldD/PmbA family protein [Candidatus Nanoarchaeia archaeon]